MRMGDDSRDEELTTNFDAEVLSDGLNNGLSSVELARSGTTDLNEVGAHRFAERERERE